MKKYLLIVVSLLITTFLFSEEIQRQYCGSIYKTVMNDSNVNIRSLPTTKSESLGKANKGDVVYILGCSVNKETLDNYNGYWLRVSFSEKVENHFKLSDGWIFSKYIDTDKKVEVSTFKVEGVKNEHNRILLDVSINRGSEKHDLVIYPRCLSGEKFYSFTWSDDESDFFYTDPVGTFIWEPSTNEIKHVSYIGYSLESAWCLITDDMKYLLQDYGTSSGVRALGIFDIKSGKEVYSASYYNDLEYDGKNITIVTPVNNWSKSQDQVTNEEIQYVTDFEENQSLEEKELVQEKYGSWHEIIIKYRLNLDTLTKQRIGCQYITTQ